MVVIIVHLKIIITLLVALTWLTVFPSLMKTMGRRSNLIKI